MRSLRTRLMTRTAILLVSTLSVTAVAIYYFMRASLVSEFDAALFMEARSLSSHVEQAGDKITLEFEIGRSPDYARADHPHYFEIWRPDQSIAAKSQSLGDKNLRPPISTSTDPQYGLTPLPDGRSGRQVAFNFNPRLEDDGSGQEPGKKLSSIVVARDTAELDSILRVLAGLLLLVTVTTVIGSIVILSQLVGEGLQPLSTLASSIEQVGVADLSERLQLTNIPVEMVPVVQRLNDLLARLDCTLTREKSFTADVAHELRTPLAGLQAALDVCATRLRTPNEYQAVIQQCLSVTGDMRSMVDDLLALARADAQQLVVELEPVEISGLLAECWSPFEPVAREKLLNVQWLGNQAVVAELDREKLKLVLKNLFENAVAHSERSGWVRCDISWHDSQLEITISNNGCRVLPADVPRLFDRFWRGDTARSNSGLHCGLGLSLCQKVIDVLRGSIEVQVDGGVFLVKIRVPAPSAVSKVRVVEALGGA